MRKSNLIYRGSGKDNYHFNSTSSGNLMRLFTAEYRANCSSINGSGIKFVKIYLTMIKEALYFSPLDYF
jgi:hypothetical protein